jgi:hypothetical protein
MKLRKSSLFVFLLQLGLSFLLEVSYFFYIEPHYNDLGFAFEFDPFRYFIGKMILIVIVPLISSLSMNELLYSILQMVVSFFLVPNLILFQFMGANPLIISGIISICLFALIFERVVPIIRWTKLVERQQMGLLFLLSAILLVPFVFTYGVHISGEVFLLDVYDIREKSAMKSNFFTSYTYSLLSYWLLPLCLIYGSWKKNKPLTVFALMGLIYLFAITGNKITFFVIFVVISFLFFKSYRTKLIAMYVAFLAVLLLGIALSTAVPQIQDLLVRRFLLLPALLNVQYFEFFRNTPLFYSHSFLSTFFTYPYELSPPQLIGLKYYGGGNMTNGIISDGFLNLGTIGVFLHGFIASFIIVLFSKMRIGAVFLGLFFLLVQNFIDGALFTSLLTHGLFLFVLLSSLLISNTDHSPTGHA